MIAEAVTTATASGEAPSITAGRVKTTISTRENARLSSDPTPRQRESSSTLAAKSTSSQVSGEVRS